MEKKVYKIMMSPLEEAVVFLCQESHFHYGHRKIKALLKRKYGIEVNRKTVQKIMQKYQVQCQIKMKQLKYLNGESNIVVKNILNREFTAVKPNEKWVTDITYLPYGSKMLYLSTIIDFYNNEIISYKVSERQDVDLVIDTLKDAVEQRKPKEGILLHTDQGTVYTSYAWLKKKKASSRACPEKETAMIIP